MDHMLMMIQEDLAMWWCLSGHARFSYTESFTKLQIARFLCVDRMCSVLWPRKPQVGMLVFVTRTLGTDG